MRDEQTSDDELSDNRSDTGLYQKFRCTEAKIFLLKVRQSQKQIRVFSILPKNERNSLS